MKIIYFTTAQSQNDWNEFYPKWNISLNASNQNFHNKLIRALSLKNKVDVISIRPYSTSNTNHLVLKNETKGEKNITWHYLKRSGNKFFRAINVWPQVKKILNKLDLRSAVFLSDTINPSIISAALKAKKKYHCPLIGICTDSPSNISGTPKSYTNYLLEKSCDLQGYLALTDGLQELFNTHNKPSFIFEGIVENIYHNETYKHDRPYFFFGGALMRRYGVYNLISAFKKLERDDIDLLICGHHENEEELKDQIGDAKNIKFLKLLPVNQVIEMEKEAIACINPRPYNEDLDRYSIPSKTLEYLNSGSLVISVKNSKLQPKFEELALWSESSDVYELLRNMEKALAMTEKERLEIGSLAKLKVQELYSPETISEELQDFLLQFIK